MVEERARQGTSWPCGASAHRWLMLLCLWVFHVCEVSALLYRSTARVIRGEPSRHACCAVLKDTNGCTKRLVICFVEGKGFKESEERSERKISLVAFKSRRVLHFSGWNSTPNRNQYDP